MTRLPYWPGSELVEEAPGFRLHRLKGLATHLEVYMLAMVNPKGMELRLYFGRGASNCWGVGEWAMGERLEGHRDYLTQQEAVAAGIQLLKTEDAVQRLGGRYPRQIPTLPLREAFAVLHALQRQQRLLRHGQTYTRPANKRAGRSRSTDCVK